MQRTRPSASTFCGVTLLYVYRERHGHGDEKHHAVAAGGDIARGEGARCEEGHLGFRVAVADFDRSTRERERLRGGEGEEWTLVVDSDTRTTRARIRRPRYVDVDPDPAPTRARASKPRRPLSGGSTRPLP